ncbi:hypothetical protein M0K56_005595, partial [Klebsiella pneumoniae]|nr:hypothetical protein [Klebsiella pneumoniae]
KLTINYNINLPLIAVLLTEDDLNDFHFLAIALANKNKHQAMLLLRDKNEFAARKIMEKAGANVPSLTGRLFWR